jgi:hypothetical protein
MGPAAPYGAAVNEQDEVRYVENGAGAPIDPDLDGAGQDGADDRRDLVQAVADFVEDLVDGDGQGGEL